MCGWWLTASPNIRGHSQHEISRSLQEPRCCGKRFWGTLVSLSGYTLTKAVTLNPELLKIYLCKVAGIERPEERHTIRRGMAKLSGSIERSWACSARLTMIRRATGQNMLPQRVIQVTLVKGTTSKKTRRQVALHQTDIMGDTFWNEHGDILDSWPNHGYDAQTVWANIINAHVETY